MAALVTAGVFVAPGDVAAAPAEDPAAEDTEPTRGPDGGLEAPDAASATTIAALQNERVEVIGERTTTSSTWALPNGAMALGQSLSPVWVREDTGDGTSSADWSKVDLTLEENADGTISPKAQPAGLVLAGDGVPADGELLSMAGPAGESVGIAWTGVLPTPTLAGPRATYADVQPGVDLIVEARPTGYEQFYVLTRAPEPAQAPDLSVTVTLDGVTAAPTADGGVQVSNAGGEVVGSSATPQAWDAEVDAERTHPVTEPWTATDAAPTGLQSPPKEWGSERLPAGKPSVTDPSAGEKILPENLVTPQDEAAPVPPVVDEQAGQGEDEQAADASASTTLPLPEAAEVVAPDAVQVSLTPAEAFLRDADTQYPVVLDPAFTFGSYFDTYVQKNVANTDLSNNPELKMGTYNGGADVARPYFNWDLSGLGGATVLNSNLSLWENTSWSCAQAGWEIYAADQVTTGSRWNSRPGYYTKSDGTPWATSSQTKGYSSSCDDGVVAADTKLLIQTWVNGGFLNPTMMLKAASETDNAGWKIFNSNEGGGGPALFVEYDTPPAPPTDLIVNGAVRMDAASGFWVSNNQTTRLTATAHDPDGNSDLLFQLYREGGEMLWQGWANGVPNGGPGSVAIPAGLMTNNGRYTFMVHGYDGTLWNTNNSGMSGPWTVDLEDPGAPFVVSTDYPGDGSWKKGGGQAGNFTFSLATSDPTAWAYKYALDQPPNTTATVTNGQATTLSLTPPTDGIHVLQVQVVDKSGRASPIVKYGFNVGRAGLISPLEGSQVVRRVRLQTSGESVFTHIKYRWRRGPDYSTYSQDVATTTLTRADGTPFSAAWTPIASIGDYASWDAGLTLGHVAGPIQVQAVLATDANGAGAYSTAWITLTVSPDAQGAATDSVGPGTVNLLTGDYSLSATDVDEFGLSLGRTASSRDPKAGWELQVDQLSATQQTFSAPTATINTEFSTNAVTLSQNTDYGHSATLPTGAAPTPTFNSLRMTTTGASADSYAQFLLPNTALSAGHTYRASGWISPQDVTGLSPQDSRGLKIVAYARDSGGTYRSYASNAPVIVNAWQQLTVDFTIPAGATDAFIRLYSGFSGADRYTYWDDLSVRELWAPLGPQWSLDTADEGSGTAYDHISLPYPDVAVLHLAGGGEVGFTGVGDTWWPEPGAEDLVLKQTGAAGSAWTLTELDGTVSSFARQDGSAIIDAPLERTSPPVGAGQTRLVYRKVDGKLRLERMIGAVEPGFDQGQCALAATTVVGCEVLELKYGAYTGTGSPGQATATAFGSFSDRLTEVSIISTATDPATLTSATTTSSVPAVRYAYDDTGRLREVWDPRISPALKTAYTYDADGRVVTIANPGELPWRFTYGTGGANSTIGSGDLVDRSSGRLLKVTRASLTPGSLTATGADTTSTVVYNVPLTRTGGGPYDLNAAAFATWAQTRGPTDATAIFGPETVPSVTTATATTPGKDGYKAATVHYLDVSAREVNTATPAGPEAPAAGYVDTAEYDRFGNVIRSLDATSRLLALGQLPTATADLATLNLTTTATPARALLLSTLNEYWPNGIDLKRTRGPLVRIAIGNDPANVWSAHDVTSYVYDEGRPDGLTYHLVTTQTDAVELSGFSSNGVPTETAQVVTVNGYNPIDGASAIGGSSGWKIGSPTTVTVDAGSGGANLTSKVRYDDQGRAVESRKVDSTGTDVGTTRSVYYSVAANGANPECGGKPAWAGLPCKNYQAGAATGTNTTRMASGLPVRTVTAYNRYGSAMAVTESATGPVAGATVTQARTTLTSYDDADRITSVAITGTGTGVGAAVAKTVNTYDPASGDVTKVATVNASGTETSSTVKVFDALGRMTKYTDAGGAWTSSVFDAYGKPTTVTDSLGTTTTFSYDRTAEPRGYVTSVVDSVAGTISATYGPDGQVTSQTLPGGVKLAIGYDANRTATSRTYTRTSDNAVISTSTGLANDAGQWITLTSAASSKTFAYDRLKRLTGVKDTTSGIGKCTARSYAYNNHAGRTSMSSASSGTGTCTDLANPGSTPVATTGYTYDSADRLVTDTATGTTGWVYDPLGRITNAPVASNPGKRVTNAFYVNDLVQSQTIDTVARQTWTLDPLQRFNTYTSETWMNNAWQQAVTKANHYDSDSDSPAWIAEDTSLPNEVTRYVDGLDGSLAMQTGKTGAKVLQLIDLHGDVMTTIPIADGQTTADWTGLRHKTADEFGNNTDLTTGGRIASTGGAPAKTNRYGWLGGAQRSTDALAGVTLMGVRLYDPATGRFWSIDPEPGGNATAYDYCTADPINCTDLDGRWGWSSIKKALKKVAKVAEIASIIPGPIGAAAAGISAVAYAATGNKKMAATMALGIAASAVGGGVALAIAKYGGSAVKAGKAALKLSKAGEFKSSIGLGKKAHKEFESFMIGKGGSAGTYLKGKGGVRAGTPDAFTRRGAPVELKPNNSRALRRGEAQLSRYEGLMGGRSDGQLWSYRLKSNGKFKFKRVRR